MAGKSSKGSNLKSIVESHVASTKHGHNIRRSSPRREACGGLDNASFADSYERELSGNTSVTHSYKRHLLHRCCTGEWWASSQPENHPNRAHRSRRHCHSPAG